MNVKTRTAPARVGVNRARNEQSASRLATLNADQSLYAALRRDNGSYGLLHFKIKSDASEFDGLSDGLRDQGLPEIYVAISTADRGSSEAANNILNAIEAGAVVPSHIPQRLRDPETGLTFWLAPMTERAQERVRRLAQPVISATSLGEEATYEVMSLTAERRGVIHSRLKADWSVPAPRANAWEDPTELPTRHQVITLNAARRGTEVTPQLPAEHQMQSRCMTLLDYTDAAEEILSRAGAASWPGDLIFGCDDGLMTVMAATGNMTLGMPLRDGRLRGGIIVRRVGSDGPLNATSLAQLCRMSWLITGEFPTSANDQVLDLATDHPEVMLGSFTQQDDSVRWQLNLITPPEPLLPWRQLTGPDQPLTGRLASYIERNDWPLPEMDWDEVMKP